MNTISKMVLTIVVTLVIIVFIIDIVLTLNNNSYHRILNPKLYKKHILETKDITGNKVTKMYKNSVERGFLNCKSKSLIICCLCRDIRSVFLHNKKKLEQIAACFKKYKIILFENDSNDNSRDILKAWEKENQNVKLISCSSFSDSKDCILNTKTGYEYGALSNMRISKMAFYRNKYLELTMKDYSDYDYMIVFDFDIKGGLYLDGMIKNFDPLLEKKWDAVFASGYQGTSIFQGRSTVLYDSLAYVNYDDSYDKKATLMHLLKDMNKKYKKPYNHDLIPIKSAFNGMAIYKIKSINNIKYSSDTRCEHIDFHKKMYDNGKKIYLSPSFILYTHQQGPPLSFSFLKNVFKKELFINI